MPTTSLNVCNDDPSPSENPSRAGIEMKGSQTPRSDVHFVDMDDRLELPDIHEDDTFTELLTALALFVTM